MYSKIPVPGFKWKDDDMAHSLVFFPFVGIVIGALVTVLNVLPVSAVLPVAVRIIITMLIPLVITGGFHADGFMDTEDALNSHASPERKLEILKDPHIGAFAVISLVKWSLIFCAAITALLLNEKSDVKVTGALGMIFVISRCLSGITSLLLRKARKDGMLYEESSGRQKGVLTALLLQLAAACIYVMWLSAVYGGVIILTFALCTVGYRFTAYRGFGGVTGDTAGFFLCVSEIIAAAVLAVMVYIF